MNLVIKSFDHRVNSLSQWVIGSRTAGRLRTKAEGLSTSSGFTIIELMVVMTIIVVLASMGLVQYRRSIIFTREAVLKEDLFRMNDAIDQVLRRQERVSTRYRLARERGLPAVHPQGSVHRLGNDLADIARRTRRPQPHGDPWYLQNHERF